MTLCVTIDTLIVYGDTAYAINFNLQIQSYSSKPHFFVCFFFSFWLCFVLDILAFLRDFLLLTLFPILTRVSSHLSALATPLNLSRATPLDLSMATWAWSTSAHAQGVK